MQVSLSKVSICCRNYLKCPLYVPPGSPRKCTKFVKQKIEKGEHSKLFTLSTRPARRDALMPSATKNNCSRDDSLNWDVVSTSFPSHRFELVLGDDSTEAFGKPEELSV